MGSATESLGGKGPASTTCSREASTHGAYLSSPFLECGKSTFTFNDEYVTYGADSPMLSWVGEPFCLRILQALEAGEKTVGELVAF